MVGFLSLCFFLSGATALVYEVVSLRMLGLVFGHTVHAVATVLIVFMGGLALGSAVFGGLTRRIRSLSQEGLRFISIALRPKSASPECSD